MTERHIVAMGGGGFSMEPDNPLLDDYVLDLSGRPTPKVCFLGTASGDADEYLARFYASFPATRCPATHLSVFHLYDTRIDDVLGDVDVIYVGGGSTPNLLALWRVHGIDRKLKMAWERGVILAGVSAGSICWFEGGVTDGYGPELAPVTNGLGLLAGSNCPHYDGEEMRRPAYRRLVQEGRIGAGIAADDGVGLHFTGTTLMRIVSSRPNAAAYRVEPGDDVASETRLSTDFLGAGNS